MPQRLAGFGIHGFGRFIAKENQPDAPSRRYNTQRQLPKCPEFSVNSLFILGKVGYGIG